MPHCAGTAGTAQHGHVFCWCPCASAQGMQDGSQYNGHVYLLTYIHGSGKPSTRSRSQPAQGRFYIVTNAHMHAYGLDVTMLPAC
jgi:hypothetical protein